MALHRKTLRIVTYNIHRCRGLDGRTLPQRAIDVLAGLKADIDFVRRIVERGIHQLGQQPEGNRSETQHAGPDLGDLPRGGTTTS